MGFSRRDFLYEIDFWEARRLIRGYDRRQRALWSAARWHAFNIMSAMPYCDLKKAGIHSPTDLIRFPWDTEQESPVTDDEVAELQELMRVANEEAGAVL